jgi:hypothetical protein
MENERFIENHIRATSRLGASIDETAEMTPTKITPIKLEIYAGKIDLLRSLGVRLKAVSELDTKLAHCRAEIHRKVAR